MKDIIINCIVKFKDRNRSVIRNTSISDHQYFTGACKTANPKNFRRNREINRVIGVSKEIGDKNLKEIVKNYPQLFRWINYDFFKDNDLFGNPKIYRYSYGIKIAADTARYIKISGDLISLFDIKKICEIGIGYGGQCAVLNRCVNINEYILVDIQPVLSLAMNYLSNFNLHNLIFKRIDDLEDRDYNTIISNYAFSELKREIQKIYLEKVILKSKQGYMIMNQITPESFNSFSKKELLKIIPNSKIIAEQPLTHKNNYTIIWGDIQTDFKTE